MASDEVYRASTYAPVNIAVIKYDHHSNTGTATAIGFKHAETTMADTGASGTPS